MAQRLSVRLLGEGVKYSGWTVSGGRWLLSHQAVTPDLPSLPPAAGFMPEFLASPHKRGAGGKGAISSVRFWTHEQLTHVIHPFDIPGLFVEAQDHSSALDKLIVSIKDLNECYMQIQRNKAELQSRLHPPGTLEHPVAWRCC